jgi:hypothetical protein
MYSFIFCLRKIYHQVLFGLMWSWSFSKNCVFLDITATSLLIWKCCLNSHPSLPRIEIGPPHNRFDYVSILGGRVRVEIKNECDCILGRPKAGSLTQLPLPGQLPKNSWKLRSRAVQVRWLTWGHHAARSLCWVSFTPLAFPPSLAYRSSALLSRFSSLSYTFSLANSSSQISLFRSWVK